MRACYSNNYWKCLTAIILVIALCDDVRSDWPGWMGSGRDNRPDDLQLPTSFDDSPPIVRWRSPIAGGYAGPAVVDGRVYLTDYVSKGNTSDPNFQRASVTGTERVLSLDASTGQVIWKHEYPVNYTISYPAGPRCTPTVDDGNVYTLGAEGDLICFEASAGTVRWQKNLPTDYSTKSALWGYAAHPLIDGQKLICVVGGDGSHTVAFDKSTGKEIWRHGTASEQGYVPPTIINAAGVRQLIVASPDYVASLNPDNGQPYWSVPYEASNGSIIMSPVVTQVGEQAYLYIAGYSNKNLMLRLHEDGPGADVLWQDRIKHAISPVNVQPMVDGGTLYGMDQGGSLMAVDLPSGNRLWETGQPLSDRPLQTGTAFIIKPKNESRYLLFTEQGDLVLAELNRERFVEIDRFAVIEPTGVAFGRKVVWSAPAINDNELFIRNDKEIICVRLNASPTP